ncbi:MFS transporter [Salipaludibacillus neizhouensis]|uniref:MFS transporter n=1 Tax=Salipaludibacillus neizhouensis TaxID=885475 RepID=A0A3A9K3S5_9BACI|nr:MFS transporter [Salipaludibacillus neizhouensis]RKL65530.1 MFS transporter [Salipaludibacillus neizhouensis]
MNKNLLKMAIFSISILTIMAGAAISPALGEISQSFPDASETTIKLLLTLPSVMIIPFIFVASYLTSRFSKKNILLVGMVIYIIGGVGGGLVSSIEMMLVCRAILGIGVGCMLPISTSLVPDFFDGEERTKTMGQVMASTNLGGVILFTASGFLASQSWRVVFSVYSLAVVSIILVYLFLPKVNPVKRSPDAVRLRLPGSVYVYGLGALMVVLVMFSIQSNIALYMVEKEIGDARYAGLIAATSTAAGFVAGLVIAQVKRLLQSYLVAAILFGVATGFGIISLAHDPLLMGVGVGICGFGLGIILPGIMDQVSRQVAPSQIVHAMAIVTSMIFVGQFLSPIILDGIGVLFGNITIEFTYQFLTIGILLTAVTFFILSLRQHILGPKQTIVPKNIDKKQQA